MDLFETQQTSLQCSLLLLDCFLQSRYLYIIFVQVGVIAIPTRNEMIAGSSILMVLRVFILDYFIIILAELEDIILIDNRLSVVEASFETSSNRLS